MIINYIDIINW